MFQRSLAPEGPALATEATPVVQKGSRRLKLFALKPQYTVAVNDLVGVVRELSAADADRVEPIVKLLQDDVERLKESTALPPTVTTAIRALQSKLKARRAAIERQTYRPEGAPPEELPHTPQDLQREAVPLKQQLAAAGFSTPALDGFISDPSALRFHSITEILNELDVIVG